MLAQQYEPLETLAPALFGSVQKWRHLPTNECVAVKRMELRFAARKRSKSSERAVEEDLFTEIKTNLRVQALGGHPNVLPLRDCIMEDEAVLLVLKFCANGELLDYPFREPLRRDDRFRLLEDFGVEYLLEKDEVDVEGKKDVVDLLRKLLVVDPAKRSTLAELQSHAALPAVDDAETRPASLTEQPEDPQLLVSNEGGRQRARSLGRFTGKGSLSSVSPDAPLSEAERNKQALAASAINPTAVAAASVAGVNGSKNPCTGGRLLRKCFPSARV
ncbi:hypothetical protein KRP22_008902 [Phytophthora ramorum]|nr:hypothetical protein KRP22_7733 [Phytophthora ramorum]